MATCRGICSFGRTGGFALEADPDLLKQCLAVRDQVWDRAIPYAQYAL